jgi:hypothetical protein
MSSSPADERQIDAVLAALVERCLELIRGDEPRGLDLIRELRKALADLYADLIRLPALGIYPAMTWLPGPDFPEREEMRSLLIQRLPAGLYWSALRPLTWETVGDTGGGLVADALLGLRQELMLNSLPKAPSLLRDEVPSLGGPILAVLTILQELASDLEAYERA